MARSPWFDTHVHLDRFAVPERTGLIERAAAAEVAMIAVAVDLDSAVEVLALPESVVAGRALGLHPRGARRSFEDTLAQLAEGRGVVAIGECGFDDAGPDDETQLWAFEAQCRVARALELAVVLHIDGARAWGLLSRSAGQLDGLRVVRHYFTGDGAQAAWHRERGHYLSFGNPLRREPALQEIARHYPAALLLIETDSYPLPGRTTEPRDVPRVGEALAMVRGWTGAQAREQLGHNTRTAFGLAEA